MTITNNLKQRIRNLDAIMGKDVYDYDNEEYINEKIPNFYTKNINGNDFSKNEIARLRKEVKYYEKYNK